MLKDILFISIVFLTNIIQGITGFAGTVLAMPAGIFLQGIETSKMVLNILGIFSSIWIVYISYKNINWKEVFKIIFIMSFGMFLGVKAFAIFPLYFLLNIYAFFIIFIGLKGIFIKKEFYLNNIILLIIILLSGIIHGMFVSGGPLIMIYISKKLKDKSQFRATLAVIWLILNSYLGIDHYSQGLFTLGNVKLLGLSLIPFIGGITLGNKLHHKISQKSFLRLSYFLLCISGLALILK